LVGGEWDSIRWVSERSHVFWGLENYGDLSYGWYQLRVRARDDAFVSHDTAAWLNFRIVKPKFRYTDKYIKTVLVVDASGYKSGSGSVVDPEDVRDLYDSALVSLKGELCEGLPCIDDYKIWYDPASSPGLATKSAPPEDVLSRYDLVIVLNVGSVPAISDDNFKAYREYLNIGGRLWLIGLNNFGLGTSVKPQFVSDFITQYFGIEQVLAPGWTLLDTTRLQFIQAESFGLWEELPTLEADTNECKKVKGYNPSVAVRQFGVRGIPYVCYVGLSNSLDFEYRIPITSDPPSVPLNSVFLLT